jgi:hypothetical protein
MVKKNITIDVDVPDGHSIGKKRSKKRKKAKAKMEIPASYKKTYEQYKGKMLDIVTRFFEEELGVVASGVKDLFNMKRKFRIMTWHLAFLFAGITLVLFGIAEYLECICSQLLCGMNFVLVGLLALIVALVYKKTA